jgi:hypothetical protein
MGCKKIVLFVAMYDITCVNIKIRIDFNRGDTNA